MSHHLASISASDESEKSKFLILETILQPVSRTNSSEHLKVLFVRGNEKLVDGEEEVGGTRVYGGAILSRNPKNIQKWLKVEIAEKTKKKFDA